MNIVIRPEADQDRDAVRSVNQAAFKGTTEADLVEALHADGSVEVSLVAEADGEVVGHILLSRVTIDAGTARSNAVSLAPMAVAPDRQRQGIGRKLVRAGLEACRDRGYSIVVVLGHPEFYPRFGFSAERAQPLESPFGGGEAWMAMELIPGALTGIEGRVEYAAPFNAFE